MEEHTDGQAFSAQIVWHAEATRYLTMAGFTILVWDHICTLDEEIKFWWTAPRSLVKYLFLVNRYITWPAQAVAVWYMSQLAVLSNLGCRFTIMGIGVFETWCLATWDLLLLFRVHALWGGHRTIVIATSILYVFTYICHTVTGFVSAVQLTPHIYYNAAARTCLTHYRPRLMSILWCFALSGETTVFVLTMIKVIEHHRSNQINNPLMASLHYGQIIYNVVIITIRVFNLTIWNLLPASLTFLGVFFIWALITTLMTRMMLHLRKTAALSPQHDQTSLFGDTVVSTRIVWARHTPALNTSLTAYSHNGNFTFNNDPETFTRGGDVEREESIALQTFWKEEKDTNLAAPIGEP